MVHPPSVHRLLVIALATAGATLSGCNKPAEAPPGAVAVSPATAPAPTPPAAAAPAPAAPPYPQPTADQLYQMVAPIALYPDKLVAQVLAAATYPAQVADADRWLRQNPGLQAGPLADAADRQAWDPSVKSLTAFGSVLDQLASNLPWTTALGEAYYHDPIDVMNAIQAMRQRASRAGRLKSTPQLKVASGNASIEATPDSNLPGVPSGPAVVAPPAQYITIAPAQPDTVYVPAYDPERIYGEPVRVYPDYVYAPPQPVYSAPRYGNAQVATAGALTFGLGVVVGSALERHDWGWHAWGMNWGDRRPPPGRDGGDAHRHAQPAVVYNRTTYVSHSQTVANNVHDTYNVYNVYNATPLPRETQARQAQPPAQVPPARMVQLQHDPSEAERMQQQQRQMQLQQAQARQQQQLLQEQARRQEQVRQEQARDQQMRAQQQRIDQARQSQEQGRAQEAQRQQQQLWQAQQQARLQEDQRRQTQERQRQQQEQARQMQEHARQAQEQQRRQDEEQGRQRQQAQQLQPPPRNQPQAHPQAEPPRHVQERPAPARPQPPHGVERQREPSPTNGRT